MIFRQTLLFEDLPISRKDLDRELTRDNGEKNVPFHQILQDRIKVGMMGRMFDSSKPNDTNLKHVTHKVNQWQYNDLCIQVEIEILDVDAGKEVLHLIGHKDSLYNLKIIPRMCKRTSDWNKIICFDIGVGLWIPHHERAKQFTKEGKHKPWQNTERFSARLKPSSGVPENLCSEITLDESHECTLKEVSLKNIEEMKKSVGEIKDIYSQMVEAFAGPMGDALTKSLKERYGTDDKHFSEL